MILELLFGAAIFGDICDEAINSAHGEIDDLKDEIEDLRNF